MRPAISTETIQKQRSFLILISYRLLMILSPVEGQSLWKHSVFPVSEKYPDSSRLPIDPFDRSKRALIDEKWGDSSIEFRLRPNATATGAYSMLLNSE